MCKCVCSCQVTVKNQSLFIPISLRGAQHECDRMWERRRDFVRKSDSDKTIRMIFFFTRNVDISFIFCLLREWKVRVFAIAYQTSGYEAFRTPSSSNGDMEQILSKKKKRIFIIRNSKALSYTHSPTVQWCSKHNFRFRMLQHFVWFPAWRAEYWE